MPSVRPSTEGVRRQTMPGREGEVHLRAAPRRDAPASSQSTAGGTSTKRWGVRRRSVVGRDDSGSPETPAATASLPSACGGRSQRGLARARAAPWERARPWATTATAARTETDRFGRRPVGVRRPASHESPRGRPARCAHMGSAPNLAVPARARRLREQRGRPDGSARLRGGVADRGVPDDRGGPRARTPRRAGRARLRRVVATSRCNSARARLRISLPRRTCPTSRRSSMPG